MIQPLARRNFSVNACIPLAVVAISLPLRADITLVDYTTNPAAAGSPAIESSSNGSSPSNIFGTSGGAVFLDLDLTSHLGAVSLTDLEVLVVSKKYPSATGSVERTLDLLRNTRYMIGVVKHVSSVVDVQSALSSTPYGVDLDLELDVESTSHTTVLNSGVAYDVMRISPSSNTFTGLPLAGGCKYSIIFQEKGFIDENGDVYSNGPLVLTMPQPGSNVIFSAYESGESIYEYNWNDEQFCYKAIHKCPVISY
ncbi:MAG: hypothetical protein J0M04_03100 [Verrucomicrobia bacterium]|nr:hypothetical protein [Verrucomicrobiota bacterium]